MAFLTSHEKKIIYFLSITLLIGIIILFLKKTFPSFYDFLSLNEFDSTNACIVKINRTNNLVYNTDKVLHSQSYKSSTRNSIKKININTATYDDLVAIPHIGPKTAQKIIEIRKKFHFSNYDDLKSIPGIGDKKSLKIKDYFIFKEQD